MLQTEHPGVFGLPSGFELPLPQVLVLCNLMFVMLMLSVNNNSTLGSALQKNLFVSQSVLLYRNGLLFTESCTRYSLQNVSAMEPDIVATRVT